jgi:hypothetical protein
MKHPRTFFLAILASGLVATSAQAQVGFESITYDGQVPEASLFSFFDSDSVGFESYREPITGIPKFDPALGTLIDVQVSFDIEYFVDSVLDSEGIFEDGIPHQVFASMFQFAIGVTYERSDGGISGFVDVDESFGIGCFGDAFEGQACFSSDFFGSGFGVSGASLIDNVAMDAVVGEGDVEIFGFAIDYIDVFFELDNIGAAFWDVGTEVDPTTASFSVTYIYDSGVSEPDTDEDGVIDALDSCINVANPGQEDSDGDGYGNACDADINNDCVVNFLDLGQLRSGFFGTDAVLDFNGDGAVNFLDLGIMRQVFFGAPGPSGLTTTCD